VFLICSTLCYARRPVAEALDRIAELEFAGVELGILRRSMHHPSLAEVIEAPLALAERFRQACPLPVRAVFAEFPSANGQESCEHFRALCRFAHATGATVLTIPAAASDTPLDEEAQRLRRFAVMAAEDGLTLCVEFRSGTVTGTVEGALALCEAVPHVGITLDVGDYIAQGYDLKAGQDLYAIVQHVHLRDASRGQPSLPLGRGTVDYSRLLSYLQRKGFRRGLSIEYLDDPPQPFDVHAEVRKLKLLMETLT